MTEKEGPERPCPEYADSLRSLVEHYPGSGAASEYEAVMTTLVEMAICRGIGAGATHSLWADGAAYALLDCFAPARQRPGSRPTGP